MRRRIAAAAICGTGMVLLVGDLLTLPLPFSLVPIAQLPFVIVGAVLVAKIPRNPVGWLLATSGLLFASMFALAGYVTWATTGVVPRGPAWAQAAAVANALFAPAIGTLVIALLYFPSGTGLGGRWRWVERLLIMVVVLGSLGTIFAPRTIDVGGPGPGIVIDTNPLELPGLLGVLAGAAGLLMTPATAPLMFLAPASLVVRYRRSDAVQRQQIKWLVYSAALSITVLFASNVASGPVGDALWITSLCLVALVPVAIGIAILRYRLYDIDVLINRTLVYGALTAVLGATYAAGVVAAEAVLGPLTKGNEAAVAVSTLLVVALFGPARRRVQALIDRRFYRSRYDAARALDAFNTRLRDEIDLEALRRDILAVVDETVRPERGGLWLRGERP